eukprot:4010339-Pleurochrysis_carterae.AAC.1
MDAALDAARLGGVGRADPPLAGGRARRGACGQALRVRGVPWLTVQVGLGVAVCGTAAQDTVEVNKYGVDEAGSFVSTAANTIELYCRIADVHAEAHQTALLLHGSSVSF